MKPRLPIPSLLFLAALCLYLPGLARQPLPGDVAVYLRRAHDLQLDSFAQTHALFLGLAHLAMRLLGWWPPALAASLLAALAAATAVALTAAILRHLGVGVAGTLFGAGALAVSHTMWFHAVIPEVYSLNAACMAGMILCALKWDKATLARPRPERVLRVPQAQPPPPGSSRWSERLAATRGAAPYSPSSTAAKPPWRRGMGVAQHASCQSVAPPAQGRWGQETLSGKALADDNRRLPNGRPFLYLAAMTFLGGLACANHMLAGITLAGCWVWVGAVVLYRWRQGRHSDCRGEASDSPRALPLVSQVWPLGVAGLLGGLGFLPLLALLWRDADTLGWPTALTMALVGGRGISGEAMVSYGGAMGAISPPRLAKSAITCLGALLYNFPSPALLALPWGVGLCRRQAGGALLIGLAVLHGAFAATYAIHEAWAFLLPAWMIVAMVAGLGFEPLAATASKWSVSKRQIQGKRTVAAILAITLLLPIALYACAPALALRLLGRSTIEEKAGGRRLAADAYLHFYLSPPKRHAQAEAEWLRQTLADLPVDAYLCLRPGYRALAFYLQRIEGIRADLALLGHNTETLAAILKAGETVFADASNPLQQLSDKTPVPLDAELLDSGLWHVRHRR